MKSGDKLLLKLRAKSWKELEKDLWIIELPAMNKLCILGYYVLDNQLN
jgi:hypothetical protein